MAKEEISNYLRSFYAQTKRQVSLNQSEFVLEDLFGIEDIKTLVAEQFEDIYQNFYLTKNVDIIKKELFSYTDIYDFLNTLLKIDMDDLIIFFTHGDILEYTVSLINVLNRAFNNWIQNRKSGFRKGTRIFLELKSDGEITLFLKPEIKT
jgi:hypothetical protein